jgi:hypothetical protein
VCYNLTFDSEEDLAAIAAGIAGGSANAPAAEPTTPAPPA